MYFHDVEKIWKYTGGLPEGFDKSAFLLTELGQKFGIRFSDDEQNAFRYIHGEPDAEYNPNTRLMGPLAAFVHSVDTLSARTWFDSGRGTGK